ncbi:PREDICTED: peroxidase 41-like [Nicotiana attenuata]|uniref:Peroxidase n=3 Tax=Nicotiana attenuata TaxID=49451 RepID=A0A1J6KCF1_NICAT|nr:PREDICTED: peroxidase 41-like [Nicotiana attenuata]OIT22640.1 peroxidase 41 [Nicotiana attenuata]
MALPWILLLLFLSFTSIPFTQSTLTLDYYAITCPKFEEIVRDVVLQKQQQFPVTAAATLRLFFHDCAVDGCDASVLIKTTAFTKPELEHDINHSLAGDGFDLISHIKTALELACPGIVSCADILATATRNLVVMTGGPHYKVPLGRKDSLVSQASSVEGKLPRANETIDQMIKTFQGLGFNIQEMVALIGGGHTIGFVHCKEFANRIFSTPGPTMNPKLAERLRGMCANYTTNTDMAAFLDVITPGTFDNMLFKNLMKGLGVLGSDQLLLSDPRTRPFVEKYANDNQALSIDFALAMEKLNIYQVKIGNQGEVRRRCDAVNTGQM